MATSHRTWVEISRAALLHNLLAIKNVVGLNVQIMPVLKANAYGHGVPEVLQTLRGQRHWGIGVAYGEEALQARENNYRGRIIALSNWQAVNLKELIRQNIELVVWDEKSLQHVLRASTSTQKPKVHIKLDTGTTRIGFLPNQRNVVEKILKNKRLHVAGIFSHFANAEERSPRRTKKQLNSFTTLTTSYHNRGIAEHIACTAAILRYPEARFGLVRLGIGLYGLWPSDEIQTWSKTHLPGFKLTPALSWHTRLAQVKTILKGTGIGYGASYVAKKNKRVGTLPIGYADGYDRGLSNAGGVIINGKFAPIVGKVCMNLCMVDLSGVPSAKPGDVVTLLGRGISADNIAQQLNTIHYEVTTRINWSIPRILV